MWGITCAEYKVHPALYEASLPVSWWNLGLKSSLTSPYSCRLQYKRLYSRAAITIHEDSQDKLYNLNNAVREGYLNMSATYGCPPFQQCCSSQWYMIYIQYDKCIWMPEQSTGGCPIGTLPVYCLINPCQYASCPALEDAKCVADYCGGCNARWILNGREVTDQCEGRNYYQCLHMRSKVLDLCHTRCVCLSFSDTNTVSLHFQLRFLQTIVILIAWLSKSLCENVFLLLWLLLE